ncbi:radical SAM protein [Pseudenhygromyxa sp. WMMC2535]|uniref:radical SAM protein n=1 Tax=Pseudenhygromyxa sp. WMMC2535 TaxID=2712867 RepID=UPI0015558300|nr:radical SAM protein [Pseudenhygromyxa sp. WMMC2535]NVB40364.1 radical SAM protein [Pseudenhygromyxa sp. WMMC2535]
MLSLPGRKVIWSILARRAAAGELRWLARVAKIGVQLKLEGLRRSGRAPSPIMAAIVVTKNCNLRCPMCELPERHRLAPSSVDTATWLHVIDELADLGTIGLSLTGGEPTLRSDIFELLAHARARGLIVAINTNALPLHGERLERFLACPPDNVNISIDSGDPAVNDRLRGGKRVLERTLERIAMLAEARARRGLQFKITVVSVLSDDNLDDLDALFEAVARSGADRLGLMPLHEVGDGVLEVARASADTRALDRRLAALSAKHALPLENSPAYLAGFHARMSGGRSCNTRCNAGYTSLIIGPDLRIYRCWPYFEKQAALRTWDVDTQRLGQLWNDETQRHDRLAALGCDACYWNCHWELNHTLEV